MPFPRQKNSTIAGLASFVTIFNCLVVLLLTFHSGCAQLNSIEISPNGEVLIDSEFVGKEGGNKIYSVILSEIKNAPSIPSDYKALSNKSYLVKSTAILYGETIYTFKIPLEAETDFKNLRILHLMGNDINPGGFEWSDCTIKSDSMDSNDKSISPEKRMRIGKFLPDFQNRRASCLLNSDEAENYFVLCTQKEEAPVQPFTQIEIRLVNQQFLAKTKETIYRMSFKNIGERSIAEVNFYSHFDTDTKVNSVKPDQGKCKASKQGSSYGSMVCHLGGLAAGTETFVEFRGASSGMGGRPTPGKLNEGWIVWGFIKENLNSANWPANRFYIEPLSSY